jgi:septal ring factor EnvC (AmiA/AmiB activator)
LIFILLTLPFSSFAQNKKELEEERKSILRRINKTNQILQKTQSDRTRLLSSVSATEQRIRQNENLLSVISKEMTWLNAETEKSGKVIAAMQNDLENLKIEYAKSLEAAYKLQNSYSRSVLIFASESIKQLLTRIFFFKKLTNLRHNQIKRIKSVQKSIALRTTELKKGLAEKEQLISAKKIQTSQLSVLKEEQSLLITVVKKKEREIMSELRLEKSSLNELNSMISSHISSKSADLLPVESKNLTLGILKNKGRLPWPVRDGFISSRFGLQPFAKENEALKDITIMKLGVDIRTEANETVRSIYEGTVVDVSEVAGRGGLIIIQHGEYFSVYSKVSNVIIKTGEKVKTKQKIANVLTQDDGVSELEFQLWRNQDKLNPESWLGK